MGVDVGNAAIDLSQIECVKKTTHLGYWVYHNICNGQAVELSWGLVDWFAPVAVVLVALMLASVMVGLVLLTFMDS